MAGSGRILGGVSTHVESIAESRIRGTGDRVTGARVQVLATLLGAGRALTHSEIEARLDSAHGVNRVTVYRVLEWLTRKGIAHKIAGEDRVWRFNVAEQGHGGHHAHFICNGCGRVLCLEDTGQQQQVELPVGFKSQSVEMTVKGLCDACGEHARRTAARSRRHSQADRAR